MAEIRVAIVGVGNCASALVQGVEYYKNADEDEVVPGLMHVNFGGYHVRDIKFVAAFEVDKRKIGKDLAEAIFAKPNCCAKFADVPKLGVEVKPGPILDGVASHMKEPFNIYDESKIKPADVAEVLKESGAEVLVNYLPVGSYNATRFYAQAAMDAGCAFVNCIPEFIASDPVWSRKFEERGLPVAGDDIKSQLGATILHRTLVKLCIDRGVIVDETYQLNLGGNTDFLNMTVEERLKTKRISKTEAVTSLVPYEIPTRIGPSDYVPFLGDKKICYITLRGRKFGNLPLTITAKLEVEDSPNSAGVVIDVIRAVKLALDRRVAGPLISICAYSFKHPPVQAPDPIAKEWVEEFIQGRRER
ncbi:MAG: inositol-3-phosphate synthase [Candidatus Bathyarchaeota archaeon]|nr:inositol-3-phosphate synthase [Candidatus Bathyarchaeota archaeon]MCX8177593.1 inositol-3-phosphate synthase [Candidatus Bathyarchaeota archaeon]MDW8194301.1 inositol-3-phosphate synthase [Nitrososphaerota archaeon]